MGALTPLGRAAAALMRGLGVLLAALLLLLAFALVLLPAGLVGRLAAAVRPRRAPPGEGYWRPVAPPRGPASYLDPF
ncbi:MAG: hypothetical protein CVU56_13620 [Deltaproteobacteria bacterium HGW-Deltaproteobacteria-14]|jgi:hypothetical protein|nr:MAG: hypothetical protein CVU56_13620 [Deltaproteobacteria bacterium HGW-Deltaproteobacteria-14]